jgi:hypothetical protein
LIATPACDRCGSSEGIPLDEHGEAIRTHDFETPGTPITWPSSVICTACRRELLASARTS